MDQVQAPHKVQMRPPSRTLALNNTPNRGGSGISWLKVAVKAADKGQDSSRHRCHFAVMLPSCSRHAL